MEHLNTMRVERAICEAMLANEHVGDIDDTSGDFADYAGIECRHCWDLYVPKGDTYTCAFCDRTHEGD